MDEDGVKKAVEGLLDLKRQMDSILKEPGRGGMSAGDDSIIKWRGKSERHVKQLRLLEAQIVARQD
jgi:hypothetical protein